MSDPLHCYLSTSQAPSRKNSHQHPRASATPPAPPPRMSCPCWDSALHGTNSACPTALSPTRPLSLPTQTYPHHQPQTRLGCLLETPGKVWVLRWDVTPASKLGAYPAVGEKLQDALDWQRMGGNAHPAPSARQTVLWALLVRSRVHLSAVPSGMLFLCPFHG